MGQFSYSAKDKTGVIQKGTTFGPDRAGAAAALVEKGLTPILVKEMDATAKTSHSFMDLLTKSGGKVKLQDKVIFSRQFSTMINAGVPIVQSLNILKQQSDSTRLKVAVADIGKQVEGGSTLGNALASHPEVFNNIYINMVRAGEMGGILDQVLDRLATQQEKDAHILGKVKGAMVYPGVITAATIGAFFFLMTVIVPGLSGIFASMGQNIPWYTKLLLGISTFMVHSWYILLGGFAAALIAYVRWHKTTNGKRTVDKIMLKMPIFGPILVKLNVARFARTFGSLMASGISVLDAINATKSSLSSTVYQDELAIVAQQVKNGRPMSEYIKGSKHFPAIVGQMLAVGEETGQLDTILLKLAEFYEDEVDTVVASITSIIEPVLIIVLGGMVGFVVISVFAPISNLSAST